MKKRLVMLAVIVSVLLLLPQFAVAGHVHEDLKKIVQKSSPEDEVRVIIKMKDAPTTTEVDAIKDEGAKVGHQFKIIKGISAKIPVKDIEKIAQRSSVEMIAPDYEIKTVMDTSATQINAKSVWAMNISGKGVNVAVIDTGISNTHPALASKVVKEVDYTGEGTDDLNGHGTHVAGTIASNDATYRGIAYGANLFDVKVLNQYGLGYSSSLIAGIDWAITNNADVISMSLGASIRPCNGSDMMSLAVDNAVAKGISVVVAAGNSGPGNSTIDSPGCSKGAITIGAVNDLDAVASFSSRGPTGDGRTKPDVVAPGVGITSTYKGGGFAALSGTSMATPHASGVAALMIEEDPSLTPSQVKEKIKASAKNLGLDANVQGSGRIDAYAAVSALAKPANLSIVNFSADQNTIYVNSSFNLILKIKNTGTKPAEQITASLLLPSSLTTAELTKELGILNGASEYAFTWTLKATSAGKSYVEADLASSNAGSASATLAITVLTPTNLTINKTPENSTGNRTLVNKTLPKGIARKNLTNVEAPGLVKKAGITPDSFWYKFKRIYEDTGMFFTFKEERKAEKKLELAEKRLAEAQAMEEKGKPEYKEELVREYKNEIAQANQIVRVAKAVAKEEEKEAKETERIERIAERAQIVEQAAKTIESHQAATAKMPSEETEVREAREVPVREVAQEKAAEKPAVKEQKTNKVQKSEQVSEEAKEEKKSSRSDSASANTVSPSSSPVAPSSAASTPASAPAASIPSESTSTTTQAAATQAAAASTTSASASSATTSTASAPAASSSSSSSGSDSRSSGASSGSSSSASASSSGSSSSGLSSSVSSGSSSSSSTGSSGSSGSGNAGGNSGGAGNSGSSNAGGNSGGSNAGGNSGGKGNKATGDAVARVARNDYAKSLFFQLIKVLI